VTAPGPAGSMVEIAQPMAVSSKAAAATAAVP